ncbi:hypothetical protein T10_2114 [Trichinella papuae]|uniref:HAT C-terminal dimerisation domain-containing protein n=1 Tax=Trichinella papuae TaxID=268474 RepID=A0A0V1NA41_9BILA|nr:hypothetical protein T10_2114 [Trichinella papuae]
MERNCKCMKSVMDFFLKSESNVEMEKNATADLGNESPQQPVRLKFPVTKFAGSDRSFCAAVQEMIENLRNDYGFLQLLSKVNTNDEFLCNKRHRKLSRKLNEFLLYDSVTVGHVVSMELKTSLKQLYYKSGSNFFDLETLKYLGDLSDVNVLAAEAEITTAKIFLQNKFGSEKAHLVEIIAILHGYKEAFPNSYQLVAAALTIGISSATCEANVSTCSRLLSPFRRSVAHARMSHLVIIFFESSILESISNEELLRRFCKAGNHRLQLR